MGSKLQLVFRRKENGAKADEQLSNPPERDPRTDWSTQVTPSGEYKSEPRAPYQKEDEESVQAFVAKYLTLADIALSTPPNEILEEQQQSFSKKPKAA